MCCFVALPMSAVLCRYGFGVGGEYPLASASAAETSQADEATRNKRGQQVVLTFSGQVSRPTRQCRHACVATWLYMTTAGVAVAVLQVLLVATAACRQPLLRSYNLPSRCNATRHSMPSVPGCLLTVTVASLLGWLPPRLSLCPVLCCAVLCHRAWAAWSTVLSSSPAWQCWA